ncbi:MAG: DUF1778 domain-containing protein [Rhizobiaceae bacterium]|nr:DUF1778 domain-containing protein [Rhizobiaceae bacterium]
MSTQESRTARIEARISPEALSIVKRAAEMQGRSVSDFVVAAAHEAAQKTIESTTRILLSLEDHQRFWDAIQTPSEPNDALRKAADAHKRLISKSS